MTAQTAGTLTFARDLAEFREHLEWTAAGRYQSEHGAVPLADALLALLGALEADAEPLDAIAAALDEWKRATQRLRNAEEAARARAAADSERLAAEEEITRKVTCPACGAEPEEKCRSLGRVSTVRTQSHQRRFRLARSLNDGATP